MRNLIRDSLLPFLVAATFLPILVSGCARSYEETISGVKVPVPKAMIRSSEKPVEMTFLGFGAGQASFHGNMDTDKVVEFYKKEMPARGWQPDMNVRSGGAMLAYSKEGKTMLVAIGKEKSETSLTLTVGGMGR
jgi:hypothetical protein